ncbi:hypothetical protein ES703_57681 [subsurface metagenome]
MISGLLDLRRFYVISVAVSEIITVLTTTLPRSANIIYLKSIIFFSAGEFI